MNIGEKIKNLRTSKLMTQKELAGEEITRNMLSQIENGCATPSLQTLVYLAGRLGVPAGYLITDGGANETFYKKYSNYPNIIKSFKSGEWAICRDLCLECLTDDGGDNEITYMLAYTSMNLGIDGFNDGKLKIAVKMFEETLDYSKMTVLDTGGLISCVAAYAEILTAISPTLTLEIPKADPQSDLVCTSDICKYSEALFGDGDGSYCTDEEKWKNPSYCYALGAKALMKNENYRAAIALYSHILEEDSLPKPIIYLVLDEYEKCCKETGDYKDAYEISQAKIQLFEKMLADI